MPCNGTKDKEVMGNLTTQTWEQLWNSAEAEEVRKKVRCCDRNCWMIGSVSPAMHKYIWIPGVWVVWHKFKSLFTKNHIVCMRIKLYVIIEMVKLQRKNWINVLRVICVQM